MSDFLSRMKQAARQDKKTIVLPEGSDQRTIEAAKKIVEEDLANLVVLGDCELDIEGVTVINPETSDKLEEYATKLAELRAHKGMTYEKALETVKEVTYFGCMMVKMGDADGLVSGACHSTADTLRPALQILKTAPGTKLVSSFMMVCVPDCELGYNGDFLFSDIGLNINPDAEGLSEIAAASAASWEAFNDTKAKVAILSYSTKGSAGGDSADKSREATRLANENHPEVEVDGELQLDAALIKEVAALKAPESTVAGNANVLVFPDLAAGNIGYKLVQRLAKAEAYGPILQGIAKPVNDLSRGCSADDIVGVVAITAVQAQMQD